MPAPVKKINSKFTYKEYQAWPDNERWEIIDGEAYAMTPVAIEVRDGGLFIRPALTVPLRTFSDEEVLKMVSEDTMEPDERDRILSKWPR